jgi:hypothetical protein
VLLFFPPPLSILSFWLLPEQHFQLELVSFSKSLNNVQETKRWLFFSVTVECLESLGFLPTQPLCSLWDVALQFLWGGHVLALPDSLEAMLFSR